MPVLREAPYSTEQIENDVAALRGAHDALEEYAEIGTLVVTTVEVAQAPGTSTSPATQETWHETGALTSGWSKNGFFKYRMLPFGSVQIAANNLNCNAATNTDGTTICSAVNGLPAAYRPASNFRLQATCDQLRVNVGTEGCALVVNTDGSFTIFGVAGAATRFDCHAIFPLGI
jgi:hypothetical protein